MSFAPLCRHVMSIINDYFEQFSHFKWQWMIKIGDDYSDYTNIEKNEFSNELAKLQLQFRWESEIERVGQEREHTKRERERRGDATHCCCRRLQRIHVASPWRPFSPDHRDMPHSICASCFAWCATFPGRLPPVDTWMKRRVCEREGGSKRGRGILTCVNLPLAFSKSAWYFTFDWIFVFSAMRFSSGVSAIAVALALGMCLQGGKKQKKKKQMRRGKRARRWVRGKVQVAVGLFFDTAHFHAACCACGMLWHTVAVAVAARKLTLQQLLLHPHFAAPRAQQHIIGHSSWNAWTAPLTVFPLSSLFFSSLWEKPLTPIWQFYQLKQHFFSLAGILIRAAFLTDFPPSPLPSFP